MLALAIGAGAGVVAAILYWSRKVYSEQNKQVADICGSDVPRVNGLITDSADILSVTTEKKLAKESEALEYRTGHQLAVITLNEVTGDIDNVGPKIGSCWGIGGEGYDDGVLITIAPENLKVRIDVGNGLMAKLTNDEAKQIIDREMIPVFRSGDFNAGTTAGIHAVIGEIG